MASRTKIYMVLEFVDGGELFDKIVRLSNSVCHIVTLLLLYIALTCRGLSFLDPGIYLDS
jgi:hypothetical protein